MLAKSIWSFLEFLLRNLLKFYILFFFETFSKNQSKRRSALDHTFGRLYENCIRQFGRIKAHYKDISETSTNIYNDFLIFIIFLSNKIYIFYLFFMMVQNQRFNLSLGYICCFIFTTSTMFYGIIIQKDNRNKAQTLFGILIRVFEKI